MENPADRLFTHCYVNVDGGNNRFVGIKMDSDKVKVYFPMGYELPDTEQDLRWDILNLISVLAEFTDIRDGTRAMQKPVTIRSTGFPINAYMEIIRHFMEQKSYYAEKEPVYKTRPSGKIDWAKTIKKKLPLIQSNGSPIYTEYITRVSSPNDKNMITQIHKFCVYESFSKIGWLFTTYLPEQPTIPLNDNMFLAFLRQKHANTYNDRDRRLLSSMISMIEYLDEKTAEKQFYLGTDRFEYVWEKLIDTVFGIKNKQDYFPRTKWMLKTGKNRINATLEPDTIMLYEDKIYVLDAKYYRYGVTGNPGHLPESGSINKQITYGEYIYAKQQFKEKYGKDGPVYNAFILPFNSRDNLFGTNNIFMNFGEATGLWKTEGYKYEKVQGVMIDVRYLMHHYIGNTKNQIIQLAQSIESAFETSAEQLPKEFSITL